MLDREKATYMKIWTTMGVLYLMTILVASLAAVEPNNLPLLKDVFAKDFLIGAALNDDVVSGRDQPAAAIVIKHFNTITPENVMKWEAIHPEPNRYDFAAADRFVDFGQKNKMFIIGHTLVWQHQTPEWVFKVDANRQATRDVMLGRMKDHIFTVMGRYKGKVNGWDVVNEALSDSGRLKAIKWSAMVGADFVAKAFEYAHQADPEAELYYNDYMLDNPARREGCVRLVKELKSKGLRIDGVGLQGHWGMDYPEREELEAFINAMASLGVKVMITEMDVDVLPSATKYRARTSASRSNYVKSLTLTSLDFLLKWARNWRTVTPSFSRFCSSTKTVSAASLSGAFTTKLPGSITIRSRDAPISLCYLTATSSPSRLSTP